MEWIIVGGGRGGAGGVVYSESLGELGGKERIVFWIFGFRERERERDEVYARKSGCTMKHRLMIFKTIVFIQESEQMINCTVRPPPTDTPPPYPFTEIPPARPLCLFHSSQKRLSKAMNNDILFTC